MSVPSAIQQKLRRALEEGEAAAAEGSVREAIQAGIDPVEIIEGILIPTLTAIGDRFQEGQVFLPELMMAGKAAEASSKPLTEAIVARGGSSTSKGKVIVGTVQGDIHDIGKNIVVTILRANGFEVLDLGRDVSPSGFVDAAKQHAPDIIGMSSLMTTTRPYVQATLNLFRDVALRDRFRFLVGGGCVTEAWANEIGADGYAPDAASAAALCKQLMRD